MTSSGPARNRVTPLGAIVATPVRGAWMGNRGVLHEGREIVRNHRSSLWITCRLSFRDRRVPQWQPGRYTPLFFLDEAVSFAAGHRPCGECRRADYIAFRAAWAEAHGVPQPSASQMNARLHQERLQPRSSVRRLHTMPWASLPDGVFVLIDRDPAVVVGDHLVTWQDADYGYGASRPRPRRGSATVITPPATVGALRAGYPVQLAAT